MKKTYLLITMFSSLIIMFSTVYLEAVTVTMTYEDPCSVMGALTNDDGDIFSLVAEGHGGPATPSISTTFFGGGHSHMRRAVAEFALEPMRDISLDPNAVTSARLRFYFDDIVFSDSSPNPWIR